MAGALGAITNSADEAVVLGNAGYMSGAGEYAGMNYTPTNSLGGALDPRALSWLAGQLTPFTPSPREKLYLRRSGVAGIHEASGAVSLNNVYGYQFAVSNLSLSFLGGQNEVSGLNGGIVLPYTSDFTSQLHATTLRSTGHFQCPPLATRLGTAQFQYRHTQVITNSHPSHSPQLRASVPAFPA